MLVEASKKDTESAKGQYLLLPSLKFSHHHRLFRTKLIIIDAVSSIIACAYLSPSAFSIVASRVDYLAAPLCSQQCHFRRPSPIITNSCGGSPLPLLHIVERTRRLQIIIAPEISKSTACRHQYRREKQGSTSSRLRSRRQHSEHIWPGKLQCTVRPRSPSAFVSRRHL